ncbi:MAG: glycosyltransferase family 4 protein, partial [Verrucomicrobia bacterium]|nr:glycosyltransferase family 4 protein [Verrucomicrobiota bacterium]
HPSFATELSQTIAQAGLSPFVHFLGDLSPTLLRDWYAAATVVAFPTYHHEGLGRVILEAQAMETPVVAYATGGVPDAIVTGKTGLLIPTGNLPKLTASLASLLSSSTLRLSLTSNARLSIETHFSLSALAERHERFYLQVISQFSKRHP